MKMWISKRKWKSIEKRVADLEQNVQSQQNTLVKHLDNHKQENEELRKTFEKIKEEIYKGIAQIL